MEKLHKQEMELGVGEIIGSRIHKKGRRGNEGSGECTQDRRGDESGEKLSRGRPGERPRLGVKDGAGEGQDTVWDNEVGKGPGENLGVKW